MAPKSMRFFDEQNWESYLHQQYFFLKHTLPETNIAPENGWLEYDPFLLGFGLFSGAFAVSFREGNSKMQAAVFQSRHVKHRFHRCSVQSLSRCLIPSGMEGTTLLELAPIPRQISLAIFRGTVLPPKGSVLEGKWDPGYFRES